MTEKNGIYKCAICGNIVEVLHSGGGDLVCCGQPMKKMVEGTSDGATEKHVPVIEACEKGCKVKVGSVPHPMEEKHWIEWIEIATAEGRRCKRYLKPGEAPEATFSCPPDKVTSVREYCNLHGLWKA